MSDCDDSPSQVPLLPATDPHEKENRAHPSSRLSSKKQSASTPSLKTPSKPSQRRNQSIVSEASGDDMDEDDVDVIESTQPKSNSNDDYDEEEEEEEAPLSRKSASRSVQKTPTATRKRKAPGRRSSKASTEDEEEEEAVTRPPMAVSMNNRSQDDSDDDLQSLGSDEQRATQIQRDASSSNKRRRVRESDLRTGDIGVIEKIKLANFMCHANLELDLAPRVNFIIGHNGSGKSAILTGLTVCLGGKAAFTNRATSLGKLIKEGQKIGQVSVTISNRGYDGYQPDRYGESITVERRFHEDGASQYKIRDERGKVVSTKKEDLTAILDHMSIQVDNPLAILTQDTARSFLGSTSPKDKYLFFLKGTLLQELSDDYVMLKAQLQELGKKIEVKAPRAAELKQEVKALAKKHEAAQAAAGLEQKFELVKNQIVWAKVQELESRIASSQAEHAKLQNKCQKADSKLQELKQGCDEGMREIAEVTEETEKYKALSEPIKEKVREVDTQKRKIRADLSALDREEQKLNSDLRRHKSAIEELEKRIQAEAKKLGGGQRAIREQKQAQIALQNDRKVELQDAINDQIRPELEQKRQRIRELTPAIDAKKAEIATLKAEEVNIVGSMMQLEQQKQNRVAVFGAKMPAVLEAIERVERQRGWAGRKPIGPLGLYVKMVGDSKYCQIVEFVLGNALSSFAVETHQDSIKLHEILDSIMDNRDRRPTVFRADRRLEEALQEAPEEYVTVLRCIEVTNREAYETIVVNFRPEQAILVDNPQEGYTVADRRPRNAGKLLTCDMYEIGLRGGRSRQALPKPARFISQLSSDPQQILRQRDEQLREVRQQISRLEDDSREALQEQSRIRADIERLQQREAQANGEISRLERSNVALNEDIRETEPANIAAIEEMKRAEEEQTEFITRQFIDLRQQKQDKAAEELPLDQQRVQLANELKVILKTADEWQVKLVNMKANQQRRESEYAYYNDQRDKYIRDAQQVAETVQRLQADLESDTAKAEQFCERVEVEKSEQELVREARDLEAKIKQVRREHGDPNELWKLYRAKADEYQRIKKNIEELVLLHKSLRDALDERFQHYTDLRHVLASGAKMIFSGLIQKRMSSGRLIFDHENQRLEIKVLNDSHAASESTSANQKDTRSLSGGEKSFSQVCLLLSLWDGMGGPLRSMDEWDIFCDPVNRRKIMLLFMEQAKTESDGAFRQYILITPQDLSAAKGLTDETVKIIRLKDPDRRGTITNFFRSQQSMA
ncbi:hypothetical protein BJ742DRAFT_794687 [Cladochytrium replicatum]|nr:hypothetical protein BJ742DRAFT_794687 [Cladochytrium replicatum]